jgi:hypothetical protein
MAVPTISIVYPGEGLTRGGDMVIIGGANFRTVPTVAAPPLYLGGDEQQTVAVWFGGVRSPYAATVSGTELHCRVPAWTGAYSTTVVRDGRQVVADALPAAVDVRVANLDDAGAEIAGEAATLADGYTYRRVSLQQTTRVEAAIGGLIEHLRRHLIHNVWWTKHRDYDDAPEDLQDYIQEKGTPLVRLQGPDWEWDRLWWAEDGELEDAAAGTWDWEQRRRRRTVEMEFLVDVWSLAEHPAELLNLAGGLVDLVHLLPDVPYTHGGTAYAHPLRMTAHPGFDIGPRLDGLKNFRCSLLVEGVPVGDADLAVIERGWEVDDLAVDGGRPS